MFVSFKSKNCINSNFFKSDIPYKTFGCEKIKSNSCFFLSYDSFFKFFLFFLIACSNSSDNLKFNVVANLIALNILSTSSFIFLSLFADQIMVLVLGIVGTPYDWVVDTALPPIEFASFASVVPVLVGSLVSGSVSLIVLILVLIVAWNYIKLLFEAAERYILVGVLIYTAPVAFATGASENTSNVFSAWCRMLGGQLFLLIMNAWCLRLFTSMVGSFLANPLSV